MVVGTVVVPSGAGADVVVVVDGSVVVVGASDVEGEESSAATSSGENPRSASAVSTATACWAALVDLFTARRLSAFVMLGYLLVQRRLNVAQVV